MSSKGNGKKSGTLAMSVDSFCPMCQFAAFTDGVSREPQWPVTAIPALM